MKKGRRAAIIAAVSVSVLAAGGLGARYLSSLESPEDRLAREARARLTYANVLQTPDVMPTWVAGKKEWIPFGALTLDDFPKPPKTKMPAPGVVRIAFVGEGAIASGAASFVEEKLAKKWGKDKIEIVDLGAINANSATTLFLLKKFVEEINAHIVVVEHGFNDLVYYRARGLGAKRIFSSPEPPNIDMNASAIGDRMGGLLGILEKANVKSADELPPWFADAPFAEPMSNHWQLARLAWSSGFTLFETAYPFPGASRYDREVREVYPLLGDNSILGLSEYRLRLGFLGKDSATEIIEAASSLGHESFWDSPFSLNESGKNEWADVVSSGLSRTIQSLLDSGAPPPKARVLVKLPQELPRIPPELVMGHGSLDSFKFKTPERTHPSLPTDHPRDGTCVEGPCPVGACFIPAGKAIYGYDNATLTKHIEVVREATGMGSPIWDEDDGPPVEVFISAFCIDRTEANEADRAKCVAAGFCPPIVVPSMKGEPSFHPAVMPSPTDAEVYCSFRGGRLPTDAEWEAAARASDSRTFPWGEGYTGKEANFCGSECRYGSKNAPNDEVDERAPIGAFGKPNPYGLVDVAGNLWEWAADCFSSGVHHDIAPGTRDPIAAPEKGCRRFLRGGSFQSYAVFLEKRNAEGLPDVDVPTRGVRCVYDFGTVHTPVGKPSGGPSR